MKCQRTLSPSAAPLGWGDLAGGLAGMIRPKETLRRLEEDFRAFFGVRHVFFVSSGKAALTIILLALQEMAGRRKVVLPGYTCFSVPSAVRRAGLAVTLCDVEPATLDFDWSQLARLLDSDTLCVLPTHLYGCIADVNRARELCRPHGAFVVEDAAQAFGGTVNGARVGTLGDVSFLSFGRGKNVTCGSGGAILTNDEGIGRAIGIQYQRLPVETNVAALKNFVEVALMQLFMRPELFWLPAGLPFLHLGETKFYTDFPMLRMDPIRCGLLHGWRRRLELATEARLARGDYYVKSLARTGGALLPIDQGRRGVALRVPVLLPSLQEKLAICELSKQQGLGVNGSYPTSLGDVPELSEWVEGSDIPQARELARRLVTVPTHQWMTDSDLARVCRLFEGIETHSGGTVDGSDVTSRRATTAGMSGAGR